MGQQLTFLDVIPDVGIELVDIAGRPSKDVCRRECQGRGRQGDAHDAVACPHRRHANAWHEVALLLGGGHDFTILRGVAPCAETQRSGECEQHTKSKQPASPTAPLIRPIL